MAFGGAEKSEIETIYRKRFDAFLFTVTALLGDGQVALDVVQEAFARALRRRRSFRRDGSLEAWLWQIVLNTGRDRRRARQREDVLAQVEPTVEVFAESPHELRSSLLALPERQRLAVFLRYYADLSYTEIAEVLGVSPGTVAASLNAAHGALRERLEEVRT